MKKIIFIFISCFLLTGCSLIPKINFDSPNTIPQLIDKSKVKEVCKGNAEWDKLGNIKSCSKGYYLYNENYNKSERKMTIIERIKSFINNLAGWSFWIFVALIIFCPSVIGFIVGRIIEAIAGIGSKALKSTVRAVQKARKENIDLNTALSTEQDADVKRYITKIKKQEKLK